MPDNFSSAIAVLLQDEGGNYVPEDHGRGPSKWGITFKTAQAYGFVKSPAEIADLTREQATTFYYVYFWNRECLDLINDLTIATKALDLSVNEGPETTIQFLLQAVNALTEMPTLAVDGILGPHTAQAVNALNPQALLQALRERAEEHYRRIVAADPSEEPNLAGWLARLDS